MEMRAKKLTVTVDCKFVGKSVNWGLVKSETASGTDMLDHGTLGDAAAVRPCNEDCPLPSTDAFRTVPVHGGSRARLGGSGSTLLQCGKNADVEDVAVTLKYTVDCKFVGKSVNWGLVKSKTASGTDMLDLGTLDDAAAVWPCNEDCPLPSTDAFRTVPVHGGSHAWLGDSGSTLLQWERDGDDNGLQEAIDGSAKRDEAVMVANTTGVKSAKATSRKRKAELNRKKRVQAKKRLARREMWLARQNTIPAIIRRYVSKAMLGGLVEPVQLSRPDIHVENGIGDNDRLKMSDKISTPSVLHVPNKNVTKTITLKDIHNPSNCVAAKQAEDGHDAAMVTKKPQQPCYIRRNIWRKQMGDHISRLQVLGKAPSDGCSIAHVISQCELDEIVERGAMMIHLTNPKRDQVTNNISWEIATPGISNHNEKTLLTKSSVFVTTYDQLQHDPKIFFLGSYYSDQPAADDWVLLALVMQMQDPCVSNDEGCIDVGQVYSQCHASKPNIVDGNSSKHHGSRGGIFGFGARREFGGIKETNGSSLGQYVCFKGQEDMSNGLETDLINQMTMAHHMVHFYAHQDLHKMNAVQLMATERQAVENNYADDFHMKEDSCYTSLYYNFSTSTMDFHTEMDWTMTTLFVPLQNWTGKDSDHLLFQFRMDEEGLEIINLAMMPGTLIYFHGYLLTHRQMHDNGRCSNKACCLNYSGYANKALRWFSFTTNARAREIVTSRH